MPRNRILLIVLALAGLCAGAPAVHAADPATLASQGRGQVVACSTCHGSDGGGQASFPRLAGQDAAYLEKQLDDFAAGKRDNAVMKPIAAGLATDERQAMAAYYAAMPVPQRLRTGRAPDDGSIGAVLALHGAWDRGVPACVQCHGPGGIGVGAHFPAIAGQPAAYIEGQLNAWKDGTRRNDPLALMQHVTAPLTPREIKAVAAWFSKQGTQVPGGAR